MLHREAQAIARVLGNFPADHLSPLVEIGSSAGNLRLMTKPYIEKVEKELHQPLRKRGVRIVTCDIKKGVGIDISDDVFDPMVQQQIRDINPRGLLCCNILEHVEDRNGFAGICSSLLQHDGILVVSAPYDFPYHEDPIDTLFRPSPEELAALFPGFSICYQEIVQDLTYWQDLISKGAFHTFIILVGRLVKHGIPFRGLERWKRFNHRLLWLFRTYKVSVVVLQKQMDSI